MKKRPFAYEKKLEDFGFSVPESSVEFLLLKLTDANRLERGRVIDDSEIIVEESRRRWLRRR